MYLARTPRLRTRLRALCVALAALAVAAATAHAAPALRGTPEADRISGTARADTIDGDAGDDVLLGGAGSDTLRGGRGNDRIEGGSGQDTVAGGTGQDTLTGGGGADRLSGGSGRDLVRARNGGRDRVDCGVGRDTAILDLRDRAVRCEVVRRPRPAAPAGVPAAATQPEPPSDQADPFPGALPAPPPADPPADSPADLPADPPLLPADDYPQLLAAGDIADCTPGAAMTAKLLEELPGTVTPLGDTAYEEGSHEEFANCYDPTWGQQKHRTRPAVGNHEYRTPGAAGYFDYFGAAAGPRGKGWYSYDLGTWHMIVLNGQCAARGGCGEGSPQLEWLRADLAAHPARCTAAYWDTPRFSSGKFHGNDLTYVPIWQVLYAHGVEFVMGGNDHHYERFAPQTPFGDLDVTDGIRQFVVGTGGRQLRPAHAVPGQNSETVNDTTRGNTFGILRVGLLDSGYEWEFVPAEGGTYADAGTTTCH